MRRVTSYRALFVVATMCGACQFSENRDLRRVVNSSELVGRWALTEESARDMAASGLRLLQDFSTFYFVLRADGTCEFKAFVGADAEGNVLGVPPSASKPCRWTKQVDRNAIRVEIGEADSVAYDVGEDVEGRLVLWKHAGDPDLWKYIEYRRQP